MDRLDQWIAANKEKLLRDIGELMSIPSVAAGEDTGIPNAPFGEECRLALDKMLSFGRRDGMKCTDEEGYCGMIRIGAEHLLKIGIWNHLDVVPAGEGWVYPPYQCTQKDGYLIGRGIIDNKGPAMAIHYAMKYLAENKLLKNIQVVHILGCQEETGMGDVKWYLAHRKLPDHSFVADCSFPVCCGEKGISSFVFESEVIYPEIEKLKAGITANSIPTRAEIMFTARSGERVEIETTGMGGHAAFPEGTLNAVGRLGESVLEYETSEKVRQLASFLAEAGRDGYGECLGIGCEDELSGRLTCNLGILRIEEGRVRVQFDIRYPVTKKIEDFKGALEKRAKEAGLRLAHFADNRPFYVDSKEPFVQALLAGYREETGDDREAYVMGGGTYARKIPKAVSFGPAQPVDLTALKLPAGHGSPHNADETETLENLLRAVRIYAKAILKLDAWAGAQQDS